LILPFLEGLVSSLILSDLFVTKRLLLVVRDAITIEVLQQRVVVLVHEARGDVFLAASRRRIGPWGSPVVAA
jgi:hypothetical protein